MLNGGLIYKFELIVWLRMHVSIDVIFIFAFSLLFIIPLNVQIKLSMFTCFTFEWDIYLNFRD